MIMRMLMIVVYVQIPLVAMVRQLKTIEFLRRQQQEMKGFSCQIFYVISCQLFLKPMEHHLLIYLVNDQIWLQIAAMIVKHRCKKTQSRQVLHIDAEILHCHQAQNITRGSDL